MLILFHPVNHVNPVYILVSLLVTLNFNIKA
jgi:hypothetical protein